jgi:hypothetical protein
MSNLHEYTKRVVREMLTESTGRHILDSGDAYGRHWEKNQELVEVEGEDVFDRQPEVLDFKFEKDGVWNAAINLYHYLTGNLYADEGWNSRLVQFSSRDEWANEAWEDAMEAFCEEYGLEVRLAAYTYNEDDWYSQNFAYWMTEFGGDDDGPIIIRIHNGYDARGGFTAPKFFNARQCCNSEFRFHAGIALMCDGETMDSPHLWTSSPGGYESHGVFMSQSGGRNIGDYEFAYEPDAAWVRDNGFCGRLVVLDGIPRCPLCGAKLSPYIEA